MSQPLLTTGQAAKLCSVDRRTILRWLDTGLLPSTKTGGRHHRIARADLLAFMGSRTSPEAQARVAVVDDDPAHADALTRIVRGTLPEAHIYTASDGFGAGLVVAAHQPHLMFLDIQMPMLDGEQALARMAAEGRLEATGVVVISGHLTHGLEQRLLGLGASRCFRKPADPKDILAALREHVPQHGAAR